MKLFNKVLLVVAVCSIWSCYTNKQRNKDYTQDRQYKNWLRYGKTINLNYAFTTDPRKVRAVICYRTDGWGTTWIMGYPNGKYADISNDTTAKGNVFKCFPPNYCKEYRDLTHHLNPEFVSIYARISYQNEWAKIMREYGDSFSINRAILNIDQKLDSQKIMELKNAIHNLRSGNCCSYGYSPGADSINMFIKSKPSIRKLMVKCYGNMSYVSDEIKHLVNGINTIDTLIILEDLLWWSGDTMIPPYHKFDFPTELLGEIYENVTFLSINSPYLKSLPDDLFRTKKRPLETLILFCDSLESLNDLSKLTNLKHLEIWNLKSFIPFDSVYKIASLEHLGINQTNIIKIDNKILNLSNLKIIEIADNLLLTELPNKVVCLPQLESLTVVPPNIGRRTFKYVRKLKKSVRQNRRNGCIKDLKSNFPVINYQSTY